MGCGAGNRFGRDWSSAGDAAARVRSRLEELARLEATLNTSSENILGKFIGALGCQPIEMLAILVLDEPGHFLRCSVDVGGFGSAAIGYRAILGEAIACGGHRLLLAHNHPSGAIEPSQIDRVSTRALAALASPLQIAIDDHLIITRNTAFSMRQAGMLDSGSCDVSG